MAYNQTPRELIPTDPPLVTINRDGIPELNPIPLTVAQVYEGNRQIQTEVVVNETTPVLETFRTGKVIGFTEMNDPGAFVIFDDIRRQIDSYRIFSHSDITAGYFCTDSIFPVIGKSISGVDGNGLEEIRAVEKLEEGDENIVELYRLYNEHILLVLEEEKEEECREPVNRKVRLSVEPPNGNGFQIRSQDVRLCCIHPRIKKFQFGQRIVETGCFSPIGKVHRILDIYHKTEYPVIGLLTDFIYEGYKYRLCRDCETVGNVSDHPVPKIGYLVSKESLFLVAENVNEKLKKAYNTLLREYNYLILEGKQFLSQHYNQYHDVLNKIFETKFKQIENPKCFIPYLPQIVVIGEGLNVIEIRRNDLQLTRGHRMRISYLFLYDPNAFPIILDLIQFSEDFPLFPLFTFVRQFKQVMHWNQLYDWVIFLNQFGSTALLFSMAKRTFLTKVKKTLIDTWNVFASIGDYRQGYYVYVLTLSLEYKFDGFFFIKCVDKFTPLFSQDWIEDPNYQSFSASGLNFKQFVQTLIDMIKRRKLNDTLKQLGRKPFEQFQHPGYYTIERFKIKPDF